VISEEAVSLELMAFTGEPAAQAAGSLVAREMTIQSPSNQHDGRGLSDRRDDMVIV
jgi:hypothetical protein